MNGFNRAWTATISRVQGNFVFNAATIGGLRGSRRLRAGPAVKHYVHRRSEPASAAITSNLFTCIKKES